MSTHQNSECLCRSLVTTSHALRQCLIYSLLMSVNLRVLKSYVSGGFLGGIRYDG